ncbi:MAG: sulfite exporter TauE/SafE family protein [Aquifex sp.]|nr:MAG: sulfite exporter TauE/SafE family protein [Aquifex sp.]
MFLSLLVYVFAWTFQAFTGFGAGIFIVGILSIFYEPKSVIISSTIVNLLGIIFMLLFLGKVTKPNFKILFPLILGSVVGIGVSAKLLIQIDKELLKALIGGFVLFLGIYDFLVQTNSLRLKLKVSRLVGIITGFLSGLFAGLIGMGGPPPVVYLNQVCKDLNTYKVTLSVFFATNVIFRIIFYLLYGGTDYWNYELILPAFLGAPMGVLFGIQLSRYFTPHFIKRFISLSVLLLGLFLLFEGLSKFTYDFFKHGVVKDSPYRCFKSHKTPGN